MQVHDLENDDLSAFDELGRLAEQMEFDLSTKKARQTDKRTTRRMVVTTKCKQIKQTQYATRGKRHYYCEAEVPDDDHYICKSRLNCTWIGGRGEC